MKIPPDIKISDQIRRIYGNLMEREVQRFERDLCWLLKHYPEDKPILIGIHSERMCHLYHCFDLAVLNSWVMKEV